MDEEGEDDFYEPSPLPSDAVDAAAGSVASQQRPGDSRTANIMAPTNEVKSVADLEEGEEKDEGEDEDGDGEEGDESDDSDIDIITERRDGSKPEPPSKAGRHHLLRRLSSRPSVPGTPTGVRDTAIHGKTEPAAKVASTSRSGADFPAVRSSKLDVDRVPTYQPLEKPLNEVDIDKDLKEHEKAWRIPGTDVSDFFNYGFDEFTWTLYCLKQEKTRDQAREDKALFNAGMMMGVEGPSLGETGAASMPPNAPQQRLNLPPVPGMPGMSGMPGVPDMPPEMQAMMAQMASGFDPSQFAPMDPAAFGMPPAGPVPPPPQAGQGAVPQGPAFGHGPQAFGNQAMNAPQMQYPFDPGMGGPDGGRNRPGNFPRGRGRPRRQHW